jgi:hypothetical protein
MCHGHPKSRFQQQCNHEVEATWAEVRLRIEIPESCARTLQRRMADEVAKAAVSELGGYTEGVDMEYKVESPRCAIVTYYFEEKIDFVSDVRVCRRQHRDNCSPRVTTYSIFAYVKVGMRGPVGCSDSFDSDTAEGIARGIFKRGRVVSKDEGIFKFLVGGLDRQ